MAKQTNQSLSRRREQFVSSWRQHAPEATFANRSLAEFEAETATAMEVRERIDRAQNELAGLIGERKNVDLVMNDLMILIAHAVRGNPEFGENSPLYRALGFVPKNERKSGLKRNPAPPAEDAGTV